MMNLFKGQTVFDLSHAVKRARSRGLNLSISIDTWPEKTSVTVKLEPARHNRGRSVKVDREVADQKVDGTLIELIDEAFCMIEAR